MPKNKNNNSHTRRETPNQPRNFEATNQQPSSTSDFPGFHVSSTHIGIGMMGTRTEHSEDSRSTEEKINDLSDIFVGDYQVDKDVIEVVLDGCDGNVNKATEKLMEMVSAGKKAKVRQRKEENDLAVIACSILADESMTSSDEGQLQAAALYSPEEKFRNDHKKFSDHEKKKVHDRRGSPINPPHSSPDYSATSYNFYTNSIDNKPRSEAKCLFKPDTCSQEFLAKNSFEDMARNMEHNAFDSTKMLGRSLSKEENYLRLGAEKNSNLPSVKLDISGNPFRSSQAPVSANSDNKRRENSFLNSIDPCLDPVASVMANNISPDVSAEWNAFYKELNLEPISNTPLSPELDISKMVDNPVSKDNENTFAILKNGKSPFPASKESDMDLLMQDKNSSEFNSFLKGHFSKEDILSLVSPDELGRQKGESAAKGPRAPSGNHGFGSRQMLNSNEFLSSESLTESHKAMTKSKNNESASPPVPNLSPFAPVSIPAAKVQGKNTASQPSIKGMPAPQPLKPLKMPKNKTFKKTKKQSQNQQFPSKESVNDAKSPSRKPVNNQNQTLEKSASQKPHRETDSSPPESEVGPYDPFGWGEITDIISSSSSTNSKPQPQRIKKTQKPARNVLPLSTTSSMTTPSPMAHDVSLGSLSLHEYSNQGENNSVSSRHKNLHQSNQSTVDSCAPVMSLSSSKSIIPKESRRASPNLHNPEESSSQPAEFPVTAKKENQKTVSSRLPPSLSIKLPEHPPPSPLLSPSSSKFPSKGPPTIQKTSSSSGSHEVFRNRVELVGIKTPRGMLRHYLSQKLPVMIILRGLPGSGKSHLARELMQEIVKANQKGVVFSTDDYFVQSGNYKFDRNYLDLAHDWNKQRALESVKKKQPFIIIDNTNSTLWELLPYAEMAIQHLYDVRLCEPDTPWKNKPQELFRKNEHGVAKEHIKRMKERYETLTTEQVIQEACKSLAARGKLTQLMRDEFGKLPQAPKTKTKEPNSPNVKRESESAKIQIEGQSMRDASAAPVLPDLGITEWTKCKEQRKPALRSKRGVVAKDPGVTSPKSPASQITLEFLNNSLKKAKVDIEKVQRESPSLENMQIEPSTGKDQTKNHSSVIESSPQTEFSLTSSAMVKDVAIDHENLLKVSCKTNDPTNIISDELKLLSLTETEGKEDGEDHEKVKIVKENENESTGNENADQKEKTFVHGFKHEIATLPSRIKSSEAVDMHLDHAEDLQSSFNSSRKLRSLFSPRDLSPANSQSEDYFSPGLASSGASSSFHSCKSEGEEAGGLDDICDVALDSVKIINRSDANRCVQDDGDIQKEIDFDVTTPATVVDAMEFNLTNASEKAEDAEMSKIHGVVQMSLFTQGAELVEDKVRLNYKEDGQDKDETSESSPNVDIINLGCEVRRLPSFTGSLVQYDDSEEESDKECSIVPHSLEAEEPIKTNEEKSVLAIPVPPVTGKSKSDESENIEEILPKTLMPSQEDSALKDEGILSNEFIDTGDGPKSTPESLASSREQSPHPSSSTSENSPAKKVKKKRIRKGRNRGPFLEETLVTASKTQAWHSFIEKSQVDATAVTVDELENSEAPEVEMISESVQCEPYYFSMVYRLNSTAFSEEPVDISVCDVVIIQVSDVAAIVHSTDDDCIIPPKKSNTLDQSTMTDETLNAEEVDLYILLNCFPAYSRKYLEEVMSVCGNNLDWVTSHLIDSPPLTDFGDQEVASKDLTRESEASSSSSPENDVTAAADNGVARSVKSLARLSMDVVKNTSQVDPDDLELQVIEAGQLRLHLIENFGKERLLSVSQESSTPDGAWTNEFCYNYFSGPLTPEECWEWSPAQDGMDKWNKPLYPLSPSSPTEGRGLSLHRSSNSPSVLLPHSTRNLFTDFSHSRMKDHHRVSNRSKQFPFRSMSQPTGTNVRPMYPSGEKERGDMERPPSSRNVPNQGQEEVRSTAPILPVDFIRSLENMYGPLGLQLDSHGLLLDDRIARKIFNCLKLQSTKTLPDCHDKEQLEKDEALAKELQEEEDAKLATSMSSDNPARAAHLGNERSPRLANHLHPSSIVGGAGESATSHARVNSVSETLHQLRGSKSKRLKPYKFMARNPNVAPSSVWVNQVKRNAASNLHSIIEEEKARDELFKRQMEVLRATGDAEALATRLKRQELSRKYPMVEAELLEEIFMNNLYSIEATERVLETQYEISPVPQTNELEHSMIEEAVRLSQMQGFEDANSNLPEFQQWPDEGEVVDYDDLRREAQMYRDLAKECQQKAQRYHREGMPSAAFFYRQEAKKYKAEEQSANQRAASVLFERGAERLQRENTLDLHSFHLDEAIKAVNTAIEMKRQDYQRRPDRRNTYVNVITGRGQNSKGGVPRLKPAIMNHLLDRNLKFEEKTSGMLKVYVFQRD